MKIKGFLFPFYTRKLRLTEVECAKSIAIMVRKLGFDPGLLGSKGVKYYKILIRR